MSLLVNYPPTGYPSVSGDYRFHRILRPEVIRALGRYLIRRIPRMVGILPFSVGAHPMHRGRRIVRIRYLPGVYR